MAKLPSIRPVLVRITGDDSLPDDDGGKHSLVCPFCKGGSKSRATAAIWYGAQTFNCQRCKVKGNSLSLKKMRRLPRQAPYGRNPDGSVKTSPAVRSQGRRLWGHGDARCYVLCDDPSMYEQCSLTAGHAGDCLYTPRFWPKPPVGWDRVSDPAYPGKQRPERGVYYQGHVYSFLRIVISDYILARGTTVPRSHRPVSGSEERGTEEVPLWVTTQHRVSLLC